MGEGGGGGLGGGESESGGEGRARLGARGRRLGRYKHLLGIEAALVEEARARAAQQGRSPRLECQRWEGASRHACIYIHIY